MKWEHLVHHVRRSYTILMQRLLDTEEEGHA